MSDSWQPMTRWQKDRKQTRVRSVQYWKTLQMWHVSTKRKILWHWFFTGQFCNLVQVWRKIWANTVQPCRKHGRDKISNQDTKSVCQLCNLQCELLVALSIKGKRNSDVTLLNLEKHHMKSLRQRMPTKWCRTWKIPPSNIKEKAQRWINLRYGISRNIGLKEKHLKFMRKFF